MTDLERAFDKAAWDATRECQRLGYRPEYTLRLINRLGTTLAAARQMLERSEDSSGFNRLYELDRLDLSVEAISLRPEFRELFSPELRAEARRRLREVNYPVPADAD